MLLFMLYFENIGASTDGSVITIYEKMKIEKQKQEFRRDRIESQLKLLPEGKLLVVQNGSYTKWLVSDGHNAIYLPKKERQLAEQLAHKRYLNLQLNHINEEINAIEQYLNLHNSNANQIEQDFINSTKFNELLLKKNPTFTDDIKAWLEEEYIKCPYSPDTLIHKSYSGNYVRSKSEALIDMLLFKNDLPFRYESRLELGSHVVYPDFTIMDPRTYEIKYWEHFGMMDKEDYARNAMNKIQDYINCGIMPGDQLITTFETRKNPLGADVVEKMIQINFM